MRDQRIKNIADEIFARFMDFAMGEFNELRAAQNRGELSHNDCLIIGAMLAVCLVTNAKEFVEMLQSDHPEFANLVYNDMISALVKCDGTVH